MTHGGARHGAGRPRGSARVAARTTITVSLPGAVLDLLHRAIGGGETRSAYVAEAIQLLAATRGEEMP